MRREFPQCDCQTADNSGNREKRQQRITSIGRFITDKFAITDNGNPQNFSSLPGNQQKKIRDAELLIYECEGTETEIKQRFETINIAGVPLNEQELLNEIYSGPLVTKAKEEFSNSQNANIQKWSAYIRGSANRQDFLATALGWVSKGDVGSYMSAHRNDKNINQLKNYFNTVIDWVSTVFEEVYPEMKGLEGGAGCTRRITPRATTRRSSRPPLKSSWPTNTPRITKASSSTC